MFPKLHPYHILDFIDDSRKLHYVFRLHLRTNPRLENNAGTRKAHPSRDKPNTRAALACMWESFPFGDIRDLRAVGAEEMSFAHPHIETHASSLTYIRTWIGVYVCVCMYRSEINFSSLPLQQVFGRIDTAARAHLAPASRATVTAALFTSQACI